MCGIDWCCSARCSISYLAIEGSRVGRSLSFHAHSSCIAHLLILPSLLGTGGLSGISKCSRRRPQNAAVPLVCHRLHGFRHGCGCPSLREPVSDGQVGRHGCVRHERDAPFALVMHLLFSKLVSAGISSLAHGFKDSGWRHLLV